MRFISTSAESSLLLTPLLAPLLTAALRPQANEEQDFCGNDVSTTKYSLLSFVPKNLWEQFQRVANLYFLLISLVQVSCFSLLPLQQHAEHTVQIFSNASPTGKYNTFLTLVVVLMVSGGKEVPAPPECTVYLHLHLHLYLHLSCSAHRLMKIGSVIRQMWPTTSAVYKCSAGQCAQPSTRP